jgi:hypothetical protein
MSFLSGAEIEKEPSRLEPMISYITTFISKRICITYKDAVIDTKI